LRGALESAPYGGDDNVKEIHLGTVVEVLQGIRASEIPGVLGRIWGSEGGSEVVDCLMKYLLVAFFLSSPVVLFCILCSAILGLTAGYR
jgi:actin related protein 2/3 complex subunit 5